MAGEISPYKCEFIEFMVRAKVLTFGDFVTKSGRNTPYFVNTGRYRTGGQLTRLSEFYARAIRDQLGSDFDILFGPAYKGIPLVVATAEALSDAHDLDVASGKPLGNPKAAQHICNGRSRDISMTMRWPPSGPKVAKAMPERDTMAPAWP